MQHLRRLEKPTYIGTYGSPAASGPGTRLPLCQPRARQP